LASFDGGAISLNQPRFDLTLYGGRRFSFFSDPSQRAIGGANLNIKLDGDASVEIQSLWYIRGSNRVVWRRRIHNQLLMSSYVRMFGGSFVDFNLSALWSSRNGRSSIRGAFFQKLTDNDYTYDYTSAATDLAAKNPLYRVYLGPINRYTQLSVEGHHQLLPNFRAGAALIVRHLDDKTQQTPFETSFWDMRFNGQYFPWNKIETFFEYHQRVSDRLSPLNETTLDGLTGTGETDVKDITANIRRAFGEGRFSLNVGAYYRRISVQDPFYFEQNLHQSGLLAGGWVRVDRHTRLYADYSLDNDFFLFAPDIKNSQVVRVGVNWKY
jgi:hypothetical protein